MKKSLMAAVVGLVLLGLTNSPAQAHWLRISPAYRAVLAYLPFVISIYGIFSFRMSENATDSELLAVTADQTEMAVDEVGIAVNWDPRVLDWTWGNVIDPWDPEKTRILVDNEAGLANIFVKSTEGVSKETFPIVSIGFYPHGLGTTDITIDTTSGECATGFWGDCGVFADGVELPIEEIFNASVTVVPVPAAVWLFGSGLLGLVGIGIRRKRALIHRPGFKE
jgi:hypothetical protein